MNTRIEVIIQFPFQNMIRMVEVMLIVIKKGANNRSVPLRHFPSVSPGASDIGHRW